MTPTVEFAANWLDKVRPGWYKRNFSDLRMSSAKRCILGISFKPRWYKPNTWFLVDSFIKGYDQFLTDNPQFQSTLARTGIFSNPVLTTEWLREIEKRRKP